MLVKGVAVQLLFQGLVDSDMERPVLIMVLNSHAGEMHQTAHVWFEAGMLSVGVWPEV